MNRHPSDPRSLPTPPPRDCASPPDRGSASRSAPERTTGLRVVARRVACPPVRSLPALALALLCLPCANAAAADPWRVGTDRQLFVDRAFFAESTNVSLRLHPPRKTGEKVLEADKPWESATLNWFNVLEDRGVIDPEARYRMWYECYDVPGWPTADDTSFCYAESRDGIRWTKPELGLFEYQGSTKNNILFRQVGSGTHRSRVHGTGIFVDPTAPPPARYKAVSQGLWADRNPPYRVAGMTSADGLRWHRLPTPICDVFADSQYAGFWDPSANQYALYGRVAGNLGRTSSPDFARFSPLELVLRADANDPPDSNLYNSAAVKYRGAAQVYLMFPSLYQHRPDTLDIRLAVSRDGLRWTYPDQATPFVPLGPTNAFDSQTLYIGQGIIDAGDETWLYYSGSPLPHNRTELEDLVRCPQPRAYSRLVTRRDRFVSAEASSSGGRFVTPPLDFAGNRLLLNAEVRAGGHLRVALLDEQHRPIPGRRLEDCQPITGDHLDALVHWKDGTDLGAWTHRPVRLEFDLRDTSLFGFQFPSSTTAALDVPRSTSAVPPP